MHLPGGAVSGRAKQCGVGECTRQHYALDMCRRHYDRYVKYGDANGGPRPAGAPSRIPPAFAQHGMTARQVEYLVERGHVVVPLDANGFRIWTPPEIATGVLTYRLHGAGLSLGLSADVARQYLAGTRSSMSVVLFPGLKLRLSLPGARTVGR